MPRESRRPAAHLGARPWFHAIHNPAADLLRIPLSLAWQPHLQAELKGFYKFETEEEPGKERLKENLVASKANSSSPGHHLQA
jgi:hypothetical protein